MQEITRFESYTVEIWRRPRQRYMRLTVRPDGRVRVSCNRRRTRSEILAFLLESKTFIEKRKTDLENLKKKYPPKNYLSDELFLHLGKRIPLNVIWGWNPKIAVKIEDGVIEMVAPLASSSEERALALRKFYRKHGRLLLEERLAHWAEIMQLRPKTLKIRGQTTRWGSCSARREISLNWKLLTAPPEVIDYVVIHELAHLRFLNHSPNFWGLVEIFHGNPISEKRWLRENEAEIAAQFS